MKVINETSEHKLRTLKNTMNRDGIILMSREINHFVSPYNSPKCYQ